MLKAAVLYRAPLPASPRFKILDLLIKILVPLGLLMSFWAVVQIGSLEGYLRLFSLQNYHKPLVALGAGYSLAFLIFQAVRAYLWWRYKPYPVPPGPHPRVTVIIPAYNEGAMVEKAIYSVAALDYPRRSIGDYLHRRRLPGRHLGVHATRSTALSKAFFPSPPGGISMILRMPKCRPP